MKLPDNYGLMSDTFIGYYITEWCKYSIHKEKERDLFWATCPNTGMTSTPFHAKESLQHSLSNPEVDIDWMD